MYDRRTRYSRTVLEKVQAEFGNNVFDTVIRYNIRLRETADLGLPVGDYDKNAIGHMDYENLAEEVIRSEETRTYQNLNTSNASQDMWQKTEKYIDAAAKLPEDEPPASEMEEFYEDESPASEVEEFPAYSSQSNYSQMIEAIANKSTDSFSNDEDGF
jgi:hypothetical protein